MTCVYLQLEAKISRIGAEWQDQPCISLSLRGLKAKNLPMGPSEKILPKKNNKLEIDFKAWYDQLQQIVFNNGPVSKTFPKSSTDKRIERFYLEIQI